MLLTIKYPRQFLILEHILQFRNITVKTPMLLHVTFFFFFQNDILAIEKLENGVSGMA